MTNTQTITANLLEEGMEIPLNNGRSSIIEGVTFFESGHVRITGHGMSLILDEMDEIEILS